MSTIEHQLENARNHDFQAGAFHEANGSGSDIGETYHTAQGNKRRAAIIKDWNAAYEAMKAIQPTFYGMLCERWGHPDSWPKEAQGRSVYEQLKAAIALMEGNSPSRDEAMVEDKPPEHEVSDEYHERVVEDDHHGKMLEDKRYERDDIYKK